MSNTFSSKQTALGIGAVGMLAPTAALADANGANESAFGVVVAVVMLVGVLFAFIAVRNGLLKSTWSLADALSEEATVTPKGQTGTPPVSAGTPMVISEMRASSSRLIALLGAIVIVFVFLGFGALALYKYATGQGIPDVDNVLKFVAGGAALFTPYAVNKLSSLGST